MSNDKAGKEYWDANWSNERVIEPIDPRQRGLTNYANRQFHKYFSRAFSGMGPHKVLLEIGCARSAWLPYFAREFGFEVQGIDYSELGCEQARQALLRAGIESKVTCADFFFPPEGLLGAFDVVVSFGVAEHWSDTTACITAFSRFLRPGGMMITIIPNLVGSIGLLQKTLNRRVFDLHVPLDAAALAQAHERSGLRVSDCGYFLSTSFGVCNLNGIRSGSAGWLVKRVVLGGVSRFSMGVWAIENMVGSLGASKLTSPYINCVARKPG